MVKGSVDGGMVEASELRWGKRDDSGGRGGESARYIMLKEGGGEGGCCMKERKI
jgi:hypothetical protein